MKRDLYHNLLKWKSNPRRKPLVLKGARQVGKTTLLRAFAKAEYPNVAYINFEKEPDACTLFNSSLDPKELLKKLRLYCDVAIEPQNTLLLFDEIQICPTALNSLKYFCEEAPEYHVISAGSLLGIKLAGDKGFPVGKVDFLQLYPLTLLEFITALGKQPLREYVESITPFTLIDLPFHNQLIELLRYYYYIGGMPEAVDVYASTHDLTEVRIAQEAILDAYQMDFSKYRGSAIDLAKIIEVFQAIPMQLTKENKKFIFSAIRESARGREFDSALQWLSDANLIYKALNVSTPALPLKTYADERAFKVYMNDVGLLSAMNNVSAKNLLQPESIFKEFHGALTENYVAEELIAAGQKQLYYWTSPGRAELDFIIDHENVIYPLEVKAGTSTHQKSLTVYREKYQPKISSRASLLNYRLDGGVANFPLYLVSQFPRVLENLLT